MARRPPRTAGRDSKTRGNYRRHDSYYHQAREQGFAARSVFKLDEIQARSRLLKRGGKVLDLGCAPGAWLQLAAREVGERGRVIGVDLAAVTIALPAQVHALQGDIYEVEASTLQELAGGPLDVVLSDLAPKTTGIRNTDQARSLALVERALEVAERVMRPGGAFVAKIFDGGDVAAFTKQLEQRFAGVRVLRPKATRTHSKEIYLIATGWKPAPAAADG